MKVFKHFIGTEHPVYIIAEMSANHNHNFSQAVKIIQAAKEAGADAVKLQTYTPDTLTIDCQNKYFQICGTVWEGRNLYDLYKEAFTPWEWHAELQKIAEDLDIDFFSTPFDASSVDFLESLDVPVYKVASFELIDLPLLKKIASTGKPVIMSTGMASLSEIDEAVATLREHGSSEIALLKCTSAYPAPIENMNLKTMVNLSQTFGVSCGLSDHSVGIAVPIAAVALGASIVEKHLTLDRNKGPDGSFSLEPKEFSEMVEAVRQTERAIGRVNYSASEKERKSKVFRRSLFVVKDIKAGEYFDKENIRSIRPGHGLAPKYFEVVIGKKATEDLARGEPLSWDMIS